MFNSKRIEEIRKNIQISTILSDHEKSDWLNLLDLMNDKQLGELEEILGVMPAVAQAQAQTQAQTQAPPSRMPPLSHIANIPTDVTMTHSVPAPSVAAPAPAKPVAPVTPARLPAKPLPPVRPPVAAAPPASIPAQSAPSAQPVNPPSQKSAPVEPVAQQRPVAAPPVLKKLSIANLTDIQAFEVATLRQYELQSIVDAIRTIIQANGYFQILQQLEASPLYRSYIQTGKFMLGEGNAEVADPETTLTQTEFEFLTDLLRHMRFNTW